MAKVRKGFEGACYVGIDPSTLSGVVRLSLGAMTEKQLTGWLRMDYQTASKYIDGEPSKEHIEKIDNEPGAPLPQIPSYEAGKEPNKNIFGSKTKAKGK